MSDFKTEFFNLEAMRNTVLSRVGEYLQLPAKLDAMAAVVEKMNNPRKEDFKIVLPSLKQRVNQKITESLALKDALFGFKDKVEKNPELAKVIKGDVGVLQFAATALFGKKTDVNAYKDYLGEALSLSKRSAKIIKEMEMLKAEILNVETGIKNNVKVNPLPEEPVRTGLNKNALYVAGGAIALLAGMSYFRRKK